MSLTELSLLSVLKGLDNGSMCVSHVSKILNDELLQIILKYYFQQNAGDRYLIALREHHFHIAKLMQDKIPNYLYESYADIAYVSAIERKDSEAEDFTCELMGYYNEDNILIVGAKMNREDIISGLIDNGDGEGIINDYAMHEIFKNQNFNMLDLLVSQNDYCLHSTVCHCINVANLKILEHLFTHNPDDWNNMIFQSIRCKHQNVLEFLLKKVPEDIYTEVYKQKCIDYCVHENCPEFIRFFVDVD